MHFLGGVISLQGSVRGCYESLWLYCNPTPTPTNPPPPMDNHQLASRTSDLAAIPDYIHDPGCRLVVRMQSRIQFVFFVLISFLLQPCPLTIGQND